MKFPFVLRSTLDAAVRERDDFRDAAAHNLKEWRDEQEGARRLFEQNLTLNARCLAVEGALERQNARYDTLMAQYHSLKVVGAVEPPKPLEAKPRDRLEEAVARSVIGLPPNLRRAAYAKLASDRKAIDDGFADEADVLADIERGHSVDDGVPA